MQASLSSPPDFLDVAETNYTANDLALVVVSSLSKPKPISEDVAKVIGILKTVMKPDHYNNVFFNICDAPKLSERDVKLVKEALPLIVEGQIKEKKHNICLKLAPSQLRIAKYAQEIGFVIHDANAQSMLMTRCLEGHTLESCPFPKFMTVSVGVTGVVFNETLQKVLLVQEKWGANKKLKPPTGTVDYLKGNDEPLSAIVRELQEEVQVNVGQAETVLVGNTYSQNFRGTNPDINYVFAFRISSDFKPIAQEDEIAHVSWVPVQEYIAEVPDEKGKRWVMREVVKKAWNAFQNKKEWSAETFYWTSGKPVTLFSYKT